ncbi:MAG TPA: toxin-activating lysine-acyltransferase [Vineibacter sp.]|nr:toxin-activating lysine-acyltransferase [Vineibacter sp.]
MAKPTASSDGGSAPAAPESDPALPAEELQRRAALAKRLAGAFGEIVSVMMRSEPHRLTYLAELEWLVVPAIVSGQFSIADAQSKSHGAVTPVAAVLWASVSPEIDARLSAHPGRPIRLKPAEWKSGDIVWIVEAIGDPRALNPMLKSLRQREWKDRTIKTRTLDAQGRPVVKELQGGDQPEAAGTS